MKTYSLYIDKRRRCQNIDYTFSMGTDIANKFTKINLWKLYKNAACCFEQIPEAALYKTAAVWLLIFHLTNPPSKRNKTFGTAEEVRTNSSVLFFHRLK